MSSISPIHAAEAAETFVAVAGGTHAEAERPKGIVLTTMDVININRYVKDALALPTDDAGVASFLGYNHAGTAGLEPSEMKSLFTAIKTNAGKWTDIERDITARAVELKATATEIVSSGQTLQDSIEKLSTVQKVKRRVGVTNIEDLQPDQTHSGVSLEASDRAAVSSLRTFLDDMIKTTQRQQKKTESVKKDVHDFRVEVGNDLEPKVRMKKALIEGSHLDDDVRKLSVAMGELDTEIDRKRSEYESAVSDSHWSLLGGLIPGLIYGARAERYRNSLNSSINAYNTDLAVWKVDKTLLGALMRLKSHLVCISANLLDAEKALGHLETLWNTTVAALSQARTDVERIDDSQSLLRFATAFAKLLIAWKTVETEAASINDELEGYRQYTVDFTGKLIKSLHTEVKTGIGTLYNSRYGSSWIMHQNNRSFIDLLFNHARSHRGKLSYDTATLVIRHLTSEAYPNPGYAPIDILVNGSVVRSNYTPQGKGWNLDRFDVTAVVQDGVNSIRLSLKDAKTDYWIYSMQIEFR